jgi:hypothetical protein
MTSGSKQLQAELARAHAELDETALANAVSAGRHALGPEEVYELFAPYVLATAKKAGKKDKSAAKREAVLGGLGAAGIPYYLPTSHDEQAKMPALDPRWLGVGLQAEHLGLVHAAGRPGHAGTIAFLSKRFDEDLKKKGSGNANDILLTMARLQHPGAADALIAAYDKFVLNAKGYTYDYWYTRIIPELPRSAISTLEAFLPKLNDRAADNWLEAIQQLREKNA